MAGVFLLLGLTVVMALASFLAGALPISMSLSQSQLRLISSIGVGILVGTSLVVIIPEGIEAVTDAMTAAAPSIHVRDLSPPSLRWAENTVIEARDAISTIIDVVKKDTTSIEALKGSTGPMIPDDGTLDDTLEDTFETKTSFKTAVEGSDLNGEEVKTSVGTAPAEHADDNGREKVPFYVGLSLILGFVLMFLIDRLPRHASENFQQPPPPRHISLNNLGGSDLTGDEEAEGFLGSLTPSPKQSRSLATTVGLVIHAAADGIALGASASGSDVQLGFIIFIAILVHKAPAAFGLTSLLLKHGLSKRAARGHLIVFSMASPVGAWATFILVNLLGGGNKAESQWNMWWTGMLLLFSAGTFLYVAMHAMQESDIPSAHDAGSGANGYAESSSQRKLVNKPQMRDTLATVAGMLLPLLTQFFHHHH